LGVVQEVEDVVEIEVGIGLTFTVAVSDTVTQPNAFVTDAVYFVTELVGDTV
jgi:hypothetical protein